MFLTQPLFGFFKKGWTRWQDWAWERGLASSWDGTVSTGFHSGGDHDGGGGEYDDHDHYYDYYDDDEELDQFGKYVAQEEK